MCLIKIDDKKNEKFKLKNLKDKKIQINFVSEFHHVSY
jgi:hypothetical protein